MRIAQITSLLLTIVAVAVICGLIFKSCAEKSGILVTDKTDTDTLINVPVIHDSIVITESDVLRLLIIQQKADSLFKIDSIRIDKTERESFKQITRRINGGYNGLADRRDLWENAKSVLYDSAYYVPLRKQSFEKAKILVDE